MNTPKDKTVIVFGSTGAIGTALVAFLSKEYASWKIQAVSRSPQSKSRLAEMKLPNVAIVEGDATNKEQVLKLSASCDIVFCCVGFERYEAKYWAKHWPPLVANLLQVVVDSKDTTKLVFCDNIYAYGPGENISVRSKVTSMSPKSKPGIRAALHETFRKFMSEHPGTVTVVGAADFFGPNVTRKSLLGDTVTGKIVLDKAGSPFAIGSCTLVHDFCYAPDFAKSLALASINDAAYDHFWIAPHSIKGKTLQTIGDIIAIKAGKPSPVKFSVLGPFLVYLLSPFMSFMWEMTEMLPFWTKAYTVDDSDFIKAFGMQATPMEEALQSLVAFYQEVEAANSK
jgi:nucleoside-diphosphate-sugar epimerase